MANANVKLEVKGTDKTGAAFKSVEWRAKAAAARLRTALGGALAAAGAYLSFRAITGTINELGKLSDQAMKAGVSVEELTSTATAFNVAGLDIGVESLTRSMQFFQKNTGKSGMPAFYDTVSEIAKMGDAAERSAALVKIFGRSGLEMQTLVNGGQQTIDKFRTLSELMPSVSQSAADSGDEFADAMTELGKGASSLWQKVVGYVVGLWGKDFPGGVRAGALNAINWIEYFCKKWHARIVYWGARAAIAFQSAWSWAKGEMSWDQAREEAGRLVEILDVDLEADLYKLEHDREQYVEKLKSVDVNDLAGAFGGVKKTGGGQRSSGESADAEGGNANNAVKTAAKIISNQLIMAESNAARRLQNIGPQYNEQIELLKKIADNTKEAADNTKKVADDAENADNPTPTDLD